MSDGSTGGAAAGVPAPPSLNRGKNRATGTATNYDATIVYINMFLTEKGYPEFDELTATHVQGDHIHDQKFRPDTGRSLSDRPETGRFLKIARFEPEKCQKASSWVPIVVFEHSFV